MQQNNNGNPVELIECLLEKTEAYSKTGYELAKLKSVETASIIATWLAARMIVFITLALFALVLNIAAGLWLGEILGKLYFGFLIVAVFYLTAGIVLHLFLHRWIKKPLAGLIITQALQ